MVVDGRQIAEEIYEDTRKRIAKLGRAPRLVIVTSAPNFETRRYLELKQKKAADVGIEVELIGLPENVTTAEICERIGSLVDTDGIIVQLPLPSHIDVEKVIVSIPSSHDVDALNKETTHVLSPVVEACKQILRRHDITVSGKSVTVLGDGRLVGAPVAKWLQKEGANVRIATKDTDDVASLTRMADVIVCGTGNPGFLTPEMVKEGAIILDAGTSEQGGMLRGDADPAVAKKASLFTQVPGGIGPMTVALLLQNLVTLAENK